MMRERELKDREIDTRKERKSDGVLGVSVCVCERERVSECVAKLCSWLLVCRHEWNKKF